MALATCRLLAPRVHVTFALIPGTYLVHRWQEQGKLMRYRVPLLNLIAL
jgi:hypothetical protein